MKASVTPTEMLKLRRRRSSCFAVANRDDEAGGEVPELGAGVHEGRRVRHEDEVAERALEALGPERGGRGPAAGGLGVPDRGRDAPHHLGRALDDLAALVLAEVA